jgi:hypothetical protein
VTCGLHPKGVVQLDGTAEARLDLEVQVAAFAGKTTGLTKKAGNVRGFSICADAPTDGSVNAMVNTAGKFTVIKSKHSIRAGYIDSCPVSARRSLAGAAGKKGIAHFRQICGIGWATDRTGPFTCGRLDQKWKSESQLKHRER